MWSGLTSFFGGANAWLSGFFLNWPYVLPATLLVSIPLIIHFINRMQFKRVRFAAMEFLLASQKRNRRRLLLEQLLLLLLRMLVVLAIVALISRPFLNPDTLSQFQGNKTHHVVLVDDSGSMRDELGKQTAFAAALDVVQKIVSEGARQPGTQTLTLAFMSKPDKPAFLLRTLDPSFQKEFDRMLSNWTCSYRSLEMAAAVQKAASVLDGQPGAAQNFHLISDFRRQDWETPGALSQSLQQLNDKRFAINLVRVVPQGNANLGITELTGNVEVAAPGIPVRLKVTVRNYGDKVVERVDLDIFEDGKQQSVTIPMQHLEPGQEMSREFDRAFAKAGNHEIRVSLPADSLLADNQRFLAFKVPEVNPVLIIDGDPEHGDALSLSDALEPSPGSTGFSPTIQSPDFLRRNSLEKYQAIYMVSLATVHPDAQRALEAFVAGGGGLCWYLGSNVNATAYNAQLYRPGFSVGREEATLAETFKKRDLNRDEKLNAAEFLGQGVEPVGPPTEGVPAVPPAEAGTAAASGQPATLAQEQAALQKAFGQLDRDKDSLLTFDEFTSPRHGLFPLRLGAVTQLPIDDGTNPAPDLQFTRHPLFVVFEGRNNPFVNLVKINSYFSPLADWAIDDGVRVIASLRNRAPLFLEHRYGKGTVLTCLTSAGPTWHNWTQSPSPSYVILQLEIEKHIARSDHTRERRIVGEAIRARLDPAVYKTDVSIRLPNGDVMTRTAVPELAGKPKTDDAGGGAGPAPVASTQYLDEFTDTDLPGVYTLVKHPLSGGEEPQRFAYNVPAAESRLQLTTSDKLRKNVGSEVPLKIQEVDQFDWIHGEHAGQDLHDLVLIGLLIFLVCEQMMALRLSFHPKRHATVAA